MKHLPTISGAALALILGLSGCGLKKERKAAVAEVERFHHHWNMDEFQAIYDEAHLNFRKSQSASEAAATLKRVKGNYGQFKSATSRGWGMNADTGITEIKLKYDSAYEHGSAVEAFVYQMADNKPLLVSYDIMTPETARKREAAEKAERASKRKAEEEKRKAEQDARKETRTPSG